MIRNIKSLKRTVFAMGTHRILSLPKELGGYRQLPPGARAFLLKAGLLFIGWKLLYLLLLLPREIPDAWLIRNTAEGACRFLNLFYREAEYYVMHQQGLRTYGGQEVTESFSFIHNGNGQTVLGIFNACTALELMILYAGFLLCFSASWIHKALFGLMGVGGIYLANVLRTCLLIEVKVSMPGLFDLAHKYLFNVVIYAWIFLWWMIFVRVADRRHQPPKMQRHVG